DVCFFCFNENTKYFIDTLLSFRRVLLRSRITGRHIFFEDMLYGDYIRDVRPVNQDVLYILNQTISANTRWQTVMTDTSKRHTTKIGRASLSVRHTNNGNEPYMSCHT